MACGCNSTGAACIGGCCPAVAAATSARPRPIPLSAKPASRRVQEGHGSIIVLGQERGRASSRRTPPCPPGAIAHSRPVVDERGASDRDDGAGRGAEQGAMTVIAANGNRQRLRMYAGENPRSGAHDPNCAIVILGHSPSSSRVLAQSDPADTPTSSAQHVAVSRGERLAHSVRMARGVSAPEQMSRALAPTTEQRFADAPALPAASLTFEWRAPEIDPRWNCCYVAAPVAPRGQVTE